MNQEQLLRKAMRLLNQGKTDLARAICRKLLHHYPDDFNSHHLYGVLLMKDGELETACEQLQQAIRLQAAPTYLAQAWNNLSQARLQLGDLPQAQAAITEALQLDHRNPLYLLNRANLFERQQNWPAMRQDLELALQLDPQLLEARISLAVCLRQSQHGEAAIEVLDGTEEALRNLDWLQEWALNLCLLGQGERLWKFIATAGLNADVISDLADYVAENGSQALSLPLYQLALQLAPDHPTASHMLAAFQGAVSERAPAQYVSDLYDRHAGEFEQRLVGKLGYDAPQQLASLLGRWLPARLQQVLDLGCGTGLMGQALQPYFSIEQLIGVDLSREMLQQAQAKGCYRQLICADLLDFQPDAPSELICASDVLIYFGDLQPLFRRLPGWLAPGGIFACTVEKADSVTPELGPSGRYRHSADYLQQLGQAAGLELLESSKIPLRSEGETMIEGLLLLFRKPAPPCSDKSGDP